VRSIKAVLRSHSGLADTRNIHSNSFRTIRGRTLCACVFDEVAVWRDELSAARQEIDAITR
jgi:hypothetical protein